MEQELSNTLYQYMKKEHLDLENELSDDEWENFLDKYQDDFANSCSELAYELFAEYLIEEEKQWNYIKFIT